MGCLRIVYEKIRIFCFHCGMVGCCAFYKGRSLTEEEEEGTVQDKTHLHGSWLIRTMDKEKKFSIVPSSDYVPTKIFIGRRKDRGQCSWFLPETCLSYSVWRASIRYTYEEKKEVWDADYKPHQGFAEMRCLVWRRIQRYYLWEVESDPAPTRLRPPRAPALPICLATACPPPMLVS